ncbi:putative cytochrome P450 [Helianthus anomalus]
MTCNPTDQAIYVFILLTGTDDNDDSNMGFSFTSQPPCGLKNSLTGACHDGRDRKVEESDMNNLVYLQAIIKETMRLYRAAPLSVPHESTQDCIVGGLNVKIIV